MDLFSLYYPCSGATVAPLYQSRLPHLRSAVQTPDLMWESVAYQWLVVYSRKQIFDQIFVLFSCPHKTTRHDYDLYSVESDVKLKINK